MVAFDAVVLTGGRGTRLGGVAKSEVVVAGTPLLQRARAAVSAARRVVVVGPDVAGGPVAGVQAGLRSVDADVVVVLACDMPLVSAATVGRLADVLTADGHGAGAPDGSAGADAAAGAEGAEAALLTDVDGRRQYLAGAYRSEALRRALAGLGAPEGCSMRRLVQALRAREVPAQAEEAMDCDTWPDVHRATELLEGR